MAVVYLWVLVPTLLFVAITLYVVFAGWTSRNVVFRAGGSSRTAPLVNVVRRDEREPERTTA
ncbi:hypothetical protein [Actinomadura rifamycini]|uniref:hypothetical protein n=1 Tax=Actinomadura rifamycini TaxID=31962 RepID=UPI00041FD028|nr:hypothetical protein [Actinomadura rifamycini]